ncbi:NAD(+)/NADH kinase [Desulfotomaculum copahuensis]|uniref:NAD kinase n=1 Tax=Desulfotomaculum copahuensis TaxID=1838280 RepID=A0A1B7LIY9_9FIRM|nr:NAD(+)/NADH kinase [Desulfotomaculum copahuensis]OAT86516.1 NAD(+) kinase [Desulfotomaculum copahuensis]
MRTAGLVVNMSKSGILALVEQLVHWFTERGCAVFMSSEAAVALNRPELGLSRAELVSRADWLLVLGGDGTLLRSARECAPRGVPLLGVNLGRLGFLTEIDRPELFSGLEQLLAGRYFLDERMMLEAQVVRHDRVVETAVGLNDAVITKGAFARLILLDTFVNDEYVSAYPADGLIVASPTGSTAYSLSAGGPLVTPELDLMLVTPICPHSLWARPLVISAESRVKAVLRSDVGEVMLTMDGQHGYRLEQNDTVLVRRAPCRAKFIRLKNRSFFYLLRQKLSEGERNDA